MSKKIVALVVISVFIASFLNILLVAQSETNNLDFVSKTIKHYFKTEKEVQELINYATENYNGTLKLKEKTMNTKSGLIEATYSGKLYKNSGPARFGYITLSSKGKRIIKIKIDNFEDKNKDNLILIVNTNGR